MNRYTDIDKLIEKYDRVHVGPAGGARKLMEEAPIADVEEVVHCDECVHLKEDNFCFEGVGGIGYKIVSPTHYCGYGRKEENDDE
jgi:hypothetical protein